MKYLSSLALILALCFSAYAQAAGSSTEVQYNDEGNFAADSRFTFNPYSGLFRVDTLGDINLGSHQGCSLDIMQSGENIWTAHPNNVVIWTAASASFGDYNGTANGIYLFINSNNQIAMLGDVDDNSSGAKLIVNDALQSVSLVTGTQGIQVDGLNSLIKLIGVPTSDPHVVGAIWNSSGTLKISAG